MKLFDINAIICLFMICGFIISFILILKNEHRFNKINARPLVIVFIVFFIGIIVSLGSLIYLNLDTDKNDKALKDPINLNLVKQSIFDQSQCTGYISPKKYINSCNLLDRAWCGGSVLLYINITPKPITCDALDLRLKNQGYYARADDLVNYYLQKKFEEKSQLDSTTQQQLIESMANGKS